MPKKKTTKIITKRCLTKSGQHTWEDIAESRDHGGWYKWCNTCGVLQSPKGKGIIFLPSL